VKFDVDVPGHRHTPGLNEWAWSFGPREWRRVATTADDLGYATLTVSEHIAIADYDVDRLGPFWPDAVSMLTFLATCTERIRVDARVLVLPYHRPVGLAKALATIDYLSAGRLNVSVGVGHSEPEFAALGVPYADRGAIMDESLDVLVELWTAPQPSFAGRFFQVQGVTFAPRPVQQPRPPIYIGGNSRPALRRAARFDGWQPNPTDTRLADLREQREYLLEHVGDRADFDVYWLDPPSTVEPLTAAAFASAQRRSEWVERYLAGVAAEFVPFGVTRTPVPAAEVGSLDEYLDYLRWFAAEVVPLAG
jgi:probable F420-dependent oxidoreductase